MCSTTLLSCISFELCKFSTSFLFYAVVSRTTVEGLPKGWIKEVRTGKRRGANRKDPFYLDPSSGYAFFSQKKTVCAIWNLEM
nr:methyl-CpG-binding domain-containing protein 13 [Tanacetum cinerariifolium]